jgi:hypothetical protein
MCFHNGNGFGGCSYECRVRKFVDVEQQVATVCANVPHDDSTSSSTIDVMRRIARTGFCCGQDMGMMVAMDGGGMMMARMLANW